MRELIDHGLIFEILRYKYPGSILNDKLGYAEQWENTAKTTNCHIYLIKQLKRMVFKEKILLKVYTQHITLSQYL